MLAYPEVTQRHWSSIWVHQLSADWSLFWSFLLMVEELLSFERRQCGPSPELE